jgi:hypothetical protein
MPDKPNDRLPAVAPVGDAPDPKVYFVVDGQKFGRPSLETYYARTQEQGATDQLSVCSCNTVAGTFCSCNKVCSCNLVCTCESVCSCQSACSCVGYKASGTGGGSYCSCNKVCTCVPVH